MSSLNEVNLIGRLGKDPEIRFTKDNKPIANFSVATSEKWKDQSGQMQEKTTWHNVVVFGGLADIVQKYLKKGSNVYLSGKLNTEKYTDKNGVEKYATKVIVDMKGKMVMLGEGQSQNNQEKPQAQPEQQSQNNQAEGFDDEIPFS